MYVCMYVCMCVCMYVCVLCMYVLCVMYYKLVLLLALRNNIFSKLVSREIGYQINVVKSHQTNHVTFRIDCFLIHKKL